MATSIFLYQELLNLQNATFSRIEHEDTMIAIVYKITQVAKKPLILKICTRTDDYLREVYFLQYFSGKLPVPRIIQVVQPTADINGAVLMECLSGTLVKKEDLTDKLAYEMGSLLAGIHLNRLAGYGDLIHPHGLSPDPRSYFTLKFEEGLDECSDHLSKGLLKQCLQYFDTHINLLEFVDGPCMVHRDFRPGNMLICDGKFQGIIDWSSARASFAEEDFSSMEHGEWSTDPMSKKPFLGGYASIRRVPDCRSLMPLLRLSKAIATIGFTVKSDTWESANNRIYQFNRRFLDSFF